VAWFDKEPLLLLTKGRMENKRQRLLLAIEAYLTRWRIEKTIRFVKQSYQLEGIPIIGL
jgi:hypothetical protein